MVLRGIVTGAVLPARSSAQVPPAWMWFMCLMPASGRSRISSVTLTPPLTSSRVAVPLTPELRLWVRSTCTVWSSWASAPAERVNTRTPNIVIARAAPLSRLARYIILLRYHRSAAIRTSGTPHMQVLALLRPSSAVGRSPRQRTITASPSPKTDPSRRAGRLVVFAQHFVRSPQVSGGSIHVAVVRLEVCLGGGGGVGRQTVSQLVGIAELSDGEDEHPVLVPVPPRWVEILDPVAVGSERGAIRFHSLEVAAGEEVVAQKLSVALEGSFDGPVVYVANLTQVLGFALPIGGALLLAGLLRLRLFGLPRLRSLRRTFIGRNHKGSCHPHARRYDKQGGRCCDVYENP